MPITVLLHVTNAQPVLGEVDEMPSPGDQFIKVSNPRQMDGKDLQFLSDKVVTVLWPFDKLNFIEILPSEEEEKIISFVRE
jgi:hypothetical protein